MDKTATRVIDVNAAIVRQRGRGRLLVVKGQDRGESVAVGDHPITLGSGSGSDVLLSDPTVSRRHLSVDTEPAQSPRQRLVNCGVGLGE